MENFQFCVSTKYIFGQGVSSKVGQTVYELGFKKVLIVYGGGSAVRSGLLSSIKEQLASYSIGYTLLGGVKPNPRANLVYEGIQIAMKEKVDFILPVGGGSVIDSAKAISLGAADSEGGDFFDFYLRKRKPTAALKVGVVLTIPAAGSESSTSTVIEKTIGGQVIKCGCSSELNRPLFAILDPELTFTVSRYQTACGVTDMMAHIMERYFTNSDGVDVTDNICEGLLRAIIKNALTVMEDPHNYNARANLMWAGSLAHNNICGVDREQDWATHHLEHQLSALYDVAHGAGLAVMFPAWMEYVFKHDVMRFARFASEVFNVPFDFDDPSVTAREGINALRYFLKSIGMPLSFKDIGAKKEDIPLLLSMLGVNEQNRSEGRFVVLYKSDCEKIYTIAADCKE